MLHFFVRAHFSLNLTNGVFQMKPRAIGDLKRLAQSNSNFKLEFVSFEPNDIHSAEFIGKSSPDRIGGNIAGNAAKAADHRVRADAGELVDGCHSADDGAISDNHVTGRHRAIRHHDAISNLAIVRDMAVSHDQTIIADSHRRVFLTRGVDRYKLPNFASLPDNDIGCFALEFQILRLRADACARPNGRPLSNLGISIDIGMGLDSDIVAKSDCFLDYGKRFYSDIFADFCARLYDGLRVYVRPAVPIFIALQLVFIY